MTKQPGLKQGGLKQAGVWIDHRKAVCVTVRDNGQETRQVESNAEKHARYSGGQTGSPHESQPGTSEDTRNRHFEGQLDRFYDEVIACLGDAEAILVFGPGEAKVELRARLERAGHGARVVGVEAADRMTDNQIVAMVRERMTSG